MNPTGLNALGTIERAPAIVRPRPRPPRALNAPQQDAVLDLLHAPRFADQAAKRTDAATSGQRDQAPAEIYATFRKATSRR
jgi:hypothetical protein